MDMGRDESAAWKDRHLLWGQRNKEQGNDEI